MKRSTYFRGLGIGSGGGAFSTGVAMGGTAALIPFTATLPLFAHFSNKADNFEILGAALLAVAYGSEANFHMENALEKFGDKINDDLERGERLETDDLARILKGLVQRNEICRVERVVKKKKNGEIKRKKNGDEKVKFKGWVMKPKKVEELIREMMRVEAEVERENRRYGIPRP